MSAARKVSRWAGLKLVRRVGKSVPFVGAFKNGVELLTRDFIHDRPERLSTWPSRRF